MDFDVTQGIAVLERTPGTLHAMWHDLGAAWIDATEGPETWGAYGIAGSCWRLGLCTTWDISHKPFA
jgi:hypothetical protein